jgi:hypothetical protein
MAKTQRWICEIIPLSPSLSPLSRGARGPDRAVAWSNLVKSSPTFNYTPKGGQLDLTFAFLVKLIKFYL